MTRLCARLCFLFPCSAEDLLQKSSRSDEYFLLMVSVIIQLRLLRNCFSPWCHPLRFTLFIYRFSLKLVQALERIWLNTSCSIGKILVMRRTYINIGFLSSNFQKVTHARYYSNTSCLLLSLKISEFFSVLYIRSYFKITRKQADNKNVVFKFMSFNFNPQ